MRSGHLNSTDPGSGRPATGTETKSPTSGRPQRAPRGRLVGPLADLESGRPRRYDVDDLRIALVRIGDDVHAIGDRCTHQDVSLADGEVDLEEAEIECGKHGSTFSLITGQPQCLPATEPTPVYRVEVVDGDVFVELDRS